MASICLLSSLSFSLLRSHFWSLCVSPWWPMMCCYSLSVLVIFLTSMGLFLQSHSLSPLSLSLSIFPSSSSSSLSFHTFSSSSSFSLSLSTSSSLFHPIYLSFTYTSSYLSNSLSQKQAMHLLTLSIILAQSSFICSTRLAKGPLQLIPPLAALSRAWN